MGTETYRRRQLSATRDMWTERGAKIGTAIGFLFERLLSGIWTLLPILCSCTLAALLFFMFIVVDSESDPADQGYIAKVLAEGPKECIVQRVKTENFGTVITKYWLRGVQRRCAVDLEREAKLRDQLSIIEKEAQK